MQEVSWCLQIIKYHSDVSLNKHTMLSAWTFRFVYREALTGLSIVYQLKVSLPTKHM